MTYTVVSRNRNSWVSTPTRDVWQITYTCGHRHRKLTGAIRCLQSLAGTPAYLRANVETYNADQMYRGQNVPIDLAYHEAQEQMLKCMKKKG